MATSLSFSYTPFMAKNYYVDGFLAPVPRKKLKEYQRNAAVLGKIWRKYGALKYVECVGDDTPKGKITSFPRSVKLKSGEVVIYSWIQYKSRAHRDAVMKKIHKDAKVAEIFENMPFDGMRMVWGGFKPFVSL